MLCKKTTLCVGGKRPALDWGKQAGRYTGYTGIQAVNRKTTTVVRCPVRVMLTIETGDGNDHDQQRTGIDPEIDRSQVCTL
jgi:hypothetical protein